MHIRKVLVTKTYGLSMERKLQMAKSAALDSYVLQSMDFMTALETLTAELRSNTAESREIVLQKWEGNLSWGRHSLCSL